MRGAQHTRRRRPRRTSRKWLVFVLNRFENQVVALSRLQVSGTLSGSTPWKWRRSGSSGGSDETAAARAHAGTTKSTFPPLMDPEPYAHLQVAGRCGCGRGYWKVSSKAFTRAMVDDMTLRDFRGQCGGTPPCHTNVSIDTHQQRQTETTTTHHMHHNHNRTRQRRHTKQQRRSGHAVPSHEFCTHALVAPTPRPRHTHAQAQDATTTTTERTMYHVPCPCWCW